MTEIAELLAEARSDAVALVTDLEADLAAIAGSTAESPDDEHDAEGSTLGYERARVKALLDQVRRRLTELSEALERVHRGDYGTCESCGGPIGWERLEALPTTRRCLACASGTSQANIR